MYCRQRAKKGSFDGAFDVRLELLDGHRLSLGKRAGGRKVCDDVVAVDCCDWFCVNELPLLTMRNTTLQKCEADGNALALGITKTSGPPIAAFVDLPPNLPSSVMRVLAPFAPPAAGSYRHVMSWDNPALSSLALGLFVYLTLVANAEYTLALLPFSLLAFMTWGFVQRRGGGYVHGWVSAGSVAAMEGNIGGRGSSDFR